MLYSPQLRLLLYDVAIIPKDKMAYPLAVIMEFKSVWRDTEDLNESANKARRLIKLETSLSYPNFKVV